jgi:nucleolar pre-ribosomal-associated protein 2
MIDIMLISQTNMENPLIKSPSNNSFTVKSFLKMPLERFSRVDRERILKSWLPDSDDKKFKDMTYESTVLNEDVLSLKVKILKRPTFYEVSTYFVLLVGRLLD